MNFPLTLPDVQIAPRAFQKKDKTGQVHVWDLAFFGGSMSVFMDDMEMFAKVPPADKVAGADKVLYDVTLNLELRPYQNGAYTNYQFNPVGVLSIAKSPQKSVPETRERRPVGNGA